MATVPSSSSPSLQLPNSFPLVYSSSIKPNQSRPFVSFTTRATDSETPSSEPSSQSEPEGSGSDDFEKRLSQIRVRYRSGTGKKSELRKARKGKKGSGSSMYLPPVPLKEPVSDGLKVDFGFSPYSERINGRIATLGLTALLLVELATGKGVINYHTLSIVQIQVYFVAAVSALYIKYEKERVSVWPQ